MMETLPKGTGYFYLQVPFHDVVAKGMILETNCDRMVEIVEIDSISWNKYHSHATVKVIGIEDEILTKSLREDKKKNPAII